MALNIKRNVKRINEESRACENKGHGKPAFIIKKSATSEYKFPFADKVPPGHYFSQVMAVYESKTRKNESSFDVCYKIRDYHYCYKKANNLPWSGKKPKCYYIKLRYPVDSDYGDDFFDAMYNAGACDDELDPQEAIGVTEHILLSYESDDAIGNIAERVPCTCDDLQEKYRIKLLEDEINRDPYYGDGYI